MRDPVIGSASTTEIPVHLLFRDEAGAGASSVPSGTTVVARRRGTGEQPKVTERAVQEPPAAVHREAAGPVERPGAVRAGWAAVAVGLGALAGCGAVLGRAGVLPGPLRGRPWLPFRTYDGLGVADWGVLAVLASAVLCAFGGLTRGREGYASVLVGFGAYRGSVRRTGLVWLSPWQGRRRVDVRLKHWRSEPLPAVDRNGIPLRVVVLVVWRVADTARASFAVADHEGHLRGQVEAELARVLAQVPPDAVRDAATVGDMLTRRIAARTARAGIEVYSVQPVRTEYAPEVAEAMRRRRIAALDAGAREKVLASVVDAVEDTVTRLAARGLTGELDDYERKALVRELTVAYLGGA
ncbi:SPFH domain-containing protein [Streptomyces sp. CA-294286]|uniref:SPFH domain-containing protein n=1 Tax=Streptomyces sp. CA-294286 TaxID=3240070 RepID=UPI003D91BC9D